MSEGARVESIDALKHFRVALIKFAEAANSALGESEADMQSRLRWLEGDQLAYWQLQIRKRQDVLDRAKDVLRMKTIFKDSTGRPPPAVEEEKAVRAAQARLEEAQMKLSNVKKYSRILRKEIDSYKGQVQRLATTLGGEIPVAITMLNNFVSTLEAYTAVTLAEMRAQAPPQEPGNQEQ